MKTIRYFFLTLFVLAPALAFAQEPTTVLTLEIGGSEYEAVGALFGEPFIAGMNIGPLPLVIVEGDGTTPDAPPDEGCDPYTPSNAAEVAGNIAFVQRGVCAFTLKAQHAAAAGAVAVIVYMDERVPDDDQTLVSMSGDCTPAEGCSAPAAFISRASGLAVLDAIAFGDEGTIVPEAPPPPPASVVIDNGNVQTSLFANGFIGSDPSFGFGEGFAFNGENTLFVSSLLIGVAGDVTSNPYDGESEFTAVQDPVLLTEFPAPYDAGARAVFTSPLGFSVTLTGYADADEPNKDFVVYNVDVTNTSGAAINGVYLGIFADWDTGTTTSTDDSGGIDTANNLVYVFDAVEGGGYYGVAAIAPPNSLSGASVDATGADDAELFTALTTIVVPGVDPAERAAVTGLGPFNIAAGATQSVQFAFIGGTDLADLLANAAAAQNVSVAVEETTPEGTFVLSSAYPNPFSSRATIGFTLPTAQDVRVTVYDMLGRQVATLVDGVRQAGAQTVEFDASSLPSGMYIYRLEAGSTQLMQRVTLVR